MTFHFRVSFGEGIKKGRSAKKKRGDLSVTAANLEQRAERGRWKGIGEQRKNKKRKKGAKGESRKMEVAAVKKKERKGKQNPNRKRRFQGKHPSELESRLLVIIVDLLLRCNSCSDCYEEAANWRKHQSCCFIAPSQSLQRLNRSRIRSRRRCPQNHSSCPHRT